MHVKESVKEFVHDVKRKFSHKRKRDSCATCNYESFDETSSDSVADDTHLYKNRASVSSSSISSPPSSPERSRFITFVRLRKPSNTSLKHYHNVLHKARRPDGKRAGITSQSSSAQIAGRSTPLSFRDAADERGMTELSQRQYMEVLDISARTSNTGESAHNSTRTEDTYGTLVAEVSGPDDRKSASDSDPRFHAVSSRPDTPPSVSPISPMAQSDSAADLREEVITLVASVDNSTAAPSRTATPPSPITPTTSASSAPVYIPRLTAPSMFLPIPNTDPPSALLTKHVPAEQRPRRDVVGEYAGRDVHDMIMSNSWRALAKMARDRIVASDPEDLGRILDLWSLRLSSLARLRLTNQASAECTNLFAVLNAVPTTSVPGSFPGSGSLPSSVPLPSSPAPATFLPLSPSGLSGLAQLPGTPSQRPSTLPPLLAGGTTPATALRQGANELVHPFELTVFHARVHYWSGDPLGYVDALSRILGQCKQRAREEGRIVAQRKEMRGVGRARGGNVEGAGQSERASEDEDDSKDEDEGTEGAEADEESTEDAEIQVEEEELDDVLVVAEANLSMWLERIARVCLILASQLIEMNDYQAAINLLAPLCTYRAPPALVPTPSPTLHSALARVYLLSGNLQKAEEHFSIAASAAGNSTNGADTDIIVMNTALLAVASGEWTRAEEALGELVAKNPGNFTAINNLAVTLLCQGRIKEGIDLLEAALKMSPSSVVVAEPFLFNLSTLYELRSTAAIDKKRELLLEVARWSGDGLKTSCLKMPSS